MSVTISIITDDSQAVLPYISKWKGIGRGKTVGEIKNETTETLSRYNLAFPTNDLELEPQYKRILKEYVRPAKLMFSGSFAEVRTFFEELQKYGDVNLRILSGRYGLIDQKTNVIPYDFNLSNYLDIQNLDKKFSISTMIKEVSLNSDILIILLPKKILEYLIKNDVFEVNNKLKITVCSKSIGSEMEKLSFKSFVRPGVARIGAKNREYIINIIDKYLIMEKDQYP